MTQEFKMLRGIDGAMITYLDHDELHVPGRIRKLLDGFQEVVGARGGAARTDEAALFKALHACGCAIDRCRGDNGYARRSRGQLYELYQRALQYLVNENIGLVYDMRKRARIADIDADELFSEGLWRLFQAVRRFDPWRGFRFSTYACTSILRGFVSLRRKKRCEAETLERLFHSTAVQEAVDPGSCELESRLLSEHVLDVLLGEEAGLTPIERFVVVRRLMQPAQAPPETLQAIGELFGLSKERIRQIQLTALGKLRHIDEEDSAARSAVATQDRGDCLIASGGDDENSVCCEHRSSMVAA